jgi:CDP-diglyceride synthetase
LFLVPALLDYRGSAFLETKEGGDLLTEHVRELMAAGFGMVYCVWFPMMMVSVRELYAIILILTVSIASIVGDLVESLLKRASHKKDSGSILPGHGGFLDRFDGVVFAFPTLYALLWFMSLGLHL